MVSVASQHHVPSLPVEKESKSYNKWITCGHDQAKHDLLLKDKQSLIKLNQEHFVFTPQKDSMYIDGNFHLAKQRKPG